MSTWVNFTSFVYNSATKPTDFLVGYIGSNEQRYPVYALKNGLSAGELPVESLYVKCDANIDGNLTVKGNLTALGTSSVFETIVSITSALSVVNTGTGPAVVVKQTGAQPIALFLDDNNNSFRLDDNFKASFFNSNATGPYSFAEGYQSVASGNSSHAEGDATVASGDGSHAEGTGTVASGAVSHAEGDGTQALGQTSHAEGTNTVARGSYSHTEGSNTICTGLASHAEGNYTRAFGDMNHVEGNSSVVAGNYSHAEGEYSIVGAPVAYASFNNTTKVFTFTSSTSAYFNGYVAGNYLYGRDFDWSGDGWYIQIADRSTINGNITAVDSPISGLSFDGILYTYVEGAHAEGIVTNAAGTGSHAEGGGSNAVGNYSHAEGYSTRASGTASHAEGGFTTASGINSHTEGAGTTASGDYSHAEGNSTTASGNSSHSEGSNTTASGDYSHAEGFNTRTYGRNSHAENTNTTASGNNSHAEGNESISYGVNSHAENQTTLAYGQASHAEGVEAIAFGTASHTEGWGTKAMGNFSHAAGYYAAAANDRSWVWKGSTDTATVSTTRTGQFMVSASGGLFLNNAVGINTDSNSNALTVNGTISSNSSLIVDALTGRNISLVHQPANDGVNPYIQLGELTTGSTIASAFSGFKLEYSENTNSLNLSSIMRTTVKNIFSIDSALPSTSFFTSKATGAESSAVGFGTFAYGNQSDAQGFSTVAQGQASHAENAFTHAAAPFSHAEGYYTRTGYPRDFSTYTAATRVFTFATTISSYFNSIKPGDKIVGVAPTLLGFPFTITVADRSTITGNITATTDVIGSDTNVGQFYEGQSGSSMHAEGGLTVAAGNYSHAEGLNTVALGNFSHAEGSTTLASGQSSHAEGGGTVAAGNYSHAAGNYANAAYDRSWIWNGSTSSDVISTTRTGQFMVSAAGGLFLNNAVGINTDAINNALTVKGVVSASDTIISNALTSRNIALLHSPANDGVNPFLAIGESTVGSNILSAFSGFRLEYNEITNTLGLSGIFGSTATGALNIDSSGTLTVVNEVVNGSLTINNNLTASGITASNSVIGSVSAQNIYSNTINTPTLSAGIVLSTTLTSRNINLIHSPANDGVDPYITIGEFTSGSNLLSAFSGFRLEYDENTNALNLSGNFGNITRDVFSIDSNGNINANGTLTVRGQTTFSGNISSTGVFVGQLSATGPVYIGTNLLPISGSSLVIRNGNVRVDGIDLSNVPNITSFDTDGQSLFDLRSASAGANYNLSIASSGIGHFMKFFGGRDGDANPFIVVKTGEPLRVASYSNYFNLNNDFTEHFRVDTSNSRVGIGTNAPTERLTVSGNVSASGVLVANSLSARNVSLLHTVANDGINPYIDIGESTVGSATLSAFSGFRLEYNENTNTLGLTGIFGDTRTRALNIDSTGSLTVANNLTAVGTITTNSVQAQTISAQTIFNPLSIINVGANSYFFTNNDLGKIFHFNTSSSTLSAIIPSNLVNGFNIGIFNTSTNFVILSSTLPIISPSNRLAAFGGAMVYTDGSSVFAVGRLSS